MINVTQAIYRDDHLDQPTQVMVQVRYSTGTNTDQVRAAAEHAAAPLLKAQNARDVDKTIYCENADITRNWGDPVILSAVYIYTIRTRTSRNYHAA